MERKKTKRIGIMGGTFDPIHIAHLISSEYIRKLYNLSEIIFIPVGIAPHKKPNVSDIHRYNMTKLAINDNEKFSISNIDIKRKKATRTIDTLNELKKIYKDSEFYFIIGTDNINNIHLWKNIDDIFSLCKFIVTKRPNYTIDDNAKGIITKYKNSIYFVDTPLIEVSSTDIRKKLAQGRCVRYTIPKEVYDYIEKNNLYKICYKNKYKKQIYKLQKNLTKDRFIHSLNVANTAKSLAIEYNEDEEKAYLAGLLHDCCKCYNKGKIYMTAKKYNIELDETIKKQIYLAHGFLGYFVAKNEYMIDDVDILTSIKYHTTGKENMTNLEKIVYIADYIEPNRTHKDAYIARELAYKDLDKTIAKILNDTIKFNKNQNRIIHKLSIGAYKYYKKGYNNG